MFRVINRYDLTQLLRYIRPRNIFIYQEAFIHRSSVKKVQKKCDTHVLKSNERLEFLGDSVLNLIITNYLFHRFPHENEGFLTKLRIKLVKGSTLAWFAKKIRLDKHIILSTSTLLNNNILENAFEALLGAIFVDYLFIGAEMLYTTKFIVGILEEFVNWEHILQDDNYKDILMRYIHKNHLPNPVYHIETMTGKVHCPIYKVSLVINEQYRSIQEGSSKREAEQSCALDVLTQLNVPITPIT